jgi:hypothetical protein
MEEERVPMWTIAVVVVALNWVARVALASVPQL